MSNNYSIFLPQEAAVPVPAAYTRNVSYDYSKNQYYRPVLSNKSNSVWTPISESQISLKGLTGNDIGEKESEKEEGSSGRPHTSLLIFLRGSRYYIRVLAILVMIVSFSLILTAIISFSKAQGKPNHPLDSVPTPAPITDRPCIVFAGISAMNLVFSIAIISLSCISSKFRKSNQAINAVFAIISAIGFSTSMGACFFLNKETKVKNDLWKWSCGNHEKGIISDALDFNLICHVVGYGWKLGLVQASLELLTFLISVTAFVLLKYSNFVRYGVVGKLF